MGMIQRIDAAWVLLGVLPVCNLEAQSSESTHKAVDALEQTIDKQSIRVEQQFPAAKLFQVSVYNVIPKELSSGKMDPRSVERSYYIGNADTFVQAVEEPSNELSKSHTVLLEKGSKPEDCKKGYPG